MVRVPAWSMEATRLAWPVASMGEVPNTVEPSRKVTSPVGMSVPVPTWATK